jgi:hypothetical protein
MPLPADRGEARKRVTELVAKFRQNLNDYIKGDSLYNETQARTDFISPLIQALGWDIYNDRAQPLDLREVIEEPTVEVGPERLSKKPDYELRLARQRKLFIEAKKPSVRIDREKASAFQTRRYGFSASLPIAVLTNFHDLVIYDCIHAPSENDEAHVARRSKYTFEQFETHFDEIYDQLSREAVYSGSFDKIFGVGVTRQGTQQFDDHFLRQVRSWRERLARDIHKNNAALTPTELTFAVQLFLSRLVFLRICEDRDIEKYENLRELEGPKAFGSLMAVLARADKFYDSGLFRLLDDKALGVRLSDDVLSSIIRELYYPQSPYTFSVVETEVLGEIYELFLGEVITVSTAGEIEIVEKPEVRESGGVVPTPRFIVDAIVERTLRPVLAGKTPTQAVGQTVADVCCGSGTFLLAAYEQILAHHLAWYVANDREKHRGVTIYEVGVNQWRLTFEEKRRILLGFIRGVDIDSAAVEVTQFSLLLKLIEDEAAAGLASYAKRHKQSVLPDLDGIIRCGNSLVTHIEFAAYDSSAPATVIEKINPFDWEKEFPADFKAGGFDVVVGNPPYIRIQNMVAYSPEEVLFYQGPKSPYTTAASDNFDKYALFIERSLSLLKPEGRLGVIVPHKFMTITAGRALRHLIADGTLLEQLIHFGAQQVFGPNTSNYTCILVLDKKGNGIFVFERVTALPLWRYGTPGTRTVAKAGDIGEEPWPIVDNAVKALFATVRARHPTKLKDVADIFVGVQTSADKIYILHPVRETKAHVVFEWEGEERKAERALLRPCLHDVRRLSPYTKPGANSYIIFPYTLSSNGAALIPPAVMAKRFPEAWAYLKARKEDLKQRNIAGGAGGSQQWYQYGRSQSLTKFNGAKIILPILSREPRYTYDDQDVVVTGGGNGPYYLIRPKVGVAHSIELLLAVLCHPLSEAIIRTRTSVFRGGYYSHGKQFIKDLPVPAIAAPKAKAIEKLVNQAIVASTAAASAKTPLARLMKERYVAALRGQIEKEVSALIGLNDADLDLLKAVPVPE